MKFLLVSLSPVEVRAGILNARCYLSLELRHSSFVIRASSFELRHSTFVIRHGTFVI